jgi:hypothetical protein
MAPPGLASGAVAVSEDSLGEEHFLGRLATYTLPDEERNGAKCCARGRSTGWTWTTCRRPGSRSTCSSPRARR